MKPREVIWIAAICIMATWILKGCFGKVEKTDKMIEDAVKVKMYEAEIPVIIHQRDSANARYDSLLSLSQSRFNDLENTKTPIYHAINQVRPSIFNYDREQLRREFANRK